MKMTARGVWTIVAAMGAAIVGGCNVGGTTTTHPTTQRWTLESKAPKTLPGRQIPSPINLLLPKSVRLHPFTGTRTFDAAGGVKGLEVRIEAFDASGDSTKAFGEFRFELYEFVANSANPKGRRLGVWSENILQPNRNQLHWDSITRTYLFKLQWYEPITVGQQFVLAAVFSSPFTDRLFTERVFVAGQ